MPNRGTTNPLLKKLIIELKKAKKPFYDRVAEELEKPSRQRAEVNLDKINKLTADGDVVIVPGKILGEGTLEHKVTAAAFQFTEGAKDKNMKIIGIAELIKAHPNGSGIKILK